MFYSDYMGTLGQIHILGGHLRGLLDNLSVGGEVKRKRLEGCGREEKGGDLISGPL